MEEKRAHAESAPDPLPKLRQSNLVRRETTVGQARLAAEAARDESDRRAEELAVRLAELSEQLGARASGQARNKEAEPGTLPEPVAPLRAAVKSNADAGVSSSTGTPPDAHGEKRDLAFAPVEGPIVDGEAGPSSAPPETNWAAGRHEAPERTVPRPQRAAASLRHCHERRRLNDVEYRSQCGSPRRWWSSPSSLSPSPSSQSAVEVVVASRPRPLWMPGSRRASPLRLRRRR